MTGDEFTNRLRLMRRRRRAMLAKKAGGRVPDDFTDMAGLSGKHSIRVPEAVPMMNEIHALYEVCPNLRIPTMRLESRTRDGRRVLKKFEKEPRTPARRILESPSVPEERKERVMNNMTTTLEVFGDRP